MSSEQYDYESTLNGYKERLSEYKDTAERLVNSSDPTEVLRTVADVVGTPLSIELLKDGLKARLGKTATALKSKIDDAAQDALSTVKGKAQELLGRAQGTLSDAKSAATATLQNLQTTAQNTVADAASTAQSAATDALGTALSTAQTVQDTAAQSLSSAQSAASDLANSVQSAAQSAASSAQSSVGSVAASSQSVLDEAAGIRQGLSQIPFTNALRDTSSLFDEGPGTEGLVAPRIRPLVEPDDLPLGLGGGRGGVAFRLPKSLTSFQPAKGEIPNLQVLTGKAPATPGQAESIVQNGLKYTRAKFGDDGTLTWDGGAALRGDSSIARAIGIERVPTLQNFGIDAPIKPPPIPSAADLDLGKVVQSTISSNAQKIADLTGLTGSDATSAAEGLGADLAGAAKGATSDVADAIADAGATIAETTGAETEGAGLIVGGLITLGATLASVFAPHKKAPSVPIPNLSIPVLQVGLGE